MADADRDSDLGDDSPMERVPAYAMADTERDSDLGEDSPMSARSETSGEHSCESSDEGVGRDVPATHQHHRQHQPHQLLQPHPSLQSHQSLLSHRRQSRPSHQPNQQINSLLHVPVPQEQMNNHAISHSLQRSSPQTLERQLRVRDDFESLKSSLHPHLSSLASLAQGAPMSTSNSVFAMASTGATTSGGFSYTPSAFLTPAPPPPAQPAGSASSSSSEGSGAGWSFEEQYKQVRQLYELSDEPERKEFLDDLFHFMSTRGAPINRLPIMAKSVLDLYELYKLVVARGGLVEVINKKMWQEVIKGLKLPSSITSAAFTLRTQYMKFLYEYECAQKGFSKKSELDAAIEGNKREGRRASSQYDAQATALAMKFLNEMEQAQRQFINEHDGENGEYDAQAAIHRQALAMRARMQGPFPSFPPSMSPVAVPLPLAQRMGVMPPPPPQMTPQDMAALTEYMKLIHHTAMMNNGAQSPPNGCGPVTMVTPQDTFNALEATRVAMSTFYHNNNVPAPVDTEPQSEALNLSPSPPSSNTSGDRRESNRSSSPRPPPPKRRASASQLTNRTSPLPAPAMATPAHANQIESPTQAANGLNANGPTTSGSISEPIASGSGAVEPTATGSSASGPTASGPSASGPSAGGSGVNGVSGPAFKIATKVDANTGEQQLTVSIEFNGTLYEGVLTPTKGPQNGRTHFTP